MCREIIYLKWNTDKLNFFQRKFIITIIIEIEIESDKYTVLEALEWLHKQKRKAVC